MPRPSNPGAPTIVAKIDLAVSGQRVRLELDLPSAPRRPVDLLPILHGVADKFVAAAVAKIQTQGESVSCRKACGACCRQLVPICPTEAYGLVRLIDAMPRARRRRVLERFDAAREKLHSAQLPDLREDFSKVDLPRRVQLGIAYLQLQIPCPFLEDESCSIHKMRPIVCREYLVTSDPAHCRAPTAETIRQVSVVKLSNTIASLDRRWSAISWMPMILAVQWARDHSDQSALRPGNEWIRDVFGAIRGTTAKTEACSVDSSEVAQSFVPFPTLNR